MGVRNSLCWELLKIRTEKATASFPSDLKTVERNKKRVGEGGLLWGRGWQRASALHCTLRSATVIWDSDDLGVFASWILSSLV